MAGYAGRTEGCQAIHDDLFAKALVIDNGEARIALLTLDLIGIDIAHVREIWERVEVETGIPPSCVMVCCSHTHSGPVMPSSDPRRDPFGEEEEEVLPRVAVLVETLVGLVKLANDNLEPVELRHVEGKLEGWSQNRRRIAAGGTPVDPQVRAFVLTDERETPFAIVTNFACHPTIMGGKNLTLSAEYPGAMARTLEAVCPDCQAMFINGACGELNPNWFHLEHDSFDSIHRMGGALAGEVMRAMYTGIQTQKPEETVILSGSKWNEMLPLWKQPDLGGAKEILSQQKSLLARAEAGDFPPNAFPFWHSMTVDENLSVPIAESYVSWAEKLVSLAEANLLVEAPEAEVQVLRIGQGGIASMPGEIFMAFGQQIKESFADHPIMVAGYTNGSLGYIPTQEAFAEAGYEVTVAQRARLIPIAEEGGELLTQWLVGLLEEAFVGGAQ